MSKRPGPNEPLTEKIINNPKDAKLLQDLGAGGCQISPCHNDGREKRPHEKRDSAVASGQPRGVRARGRAGGTGAPEKHEGARRRAVLASHREIFAAIERGDAAAARREKESRIQDIIDRNLRSMVRGRPSMVTRALSDEEAIYNA